MKSKKSCPLLSSIPLLAPPSLQLWQGGPPMIPSQLGTSDASIKVRLRLSNVVSGWLCSYAAQISLSNSFAKMISNPACLKPKSKPPAPEKKDAILRDMLKKHS